MPERTPDALRNLRTTLRVAADDLRDLEARIKYGTAGESDDFAEARQIAETLVSEIGDADADRMLS